MYGDLEEEIYVDCPQGMSNVGSDDCSNLKKCIYGLVQAVRQYYKKAVEILNESGFIRGNFDPCLYIKKSEKGIVYVALYVDDNLMIVEVEAINEAKIAPKKMGW